MLFDSGMQVQHKTGGLAWTVINYDGMYVDVERADSVGNKIVDRFLATSLRPARAASYSAVGPYNVFKDIDAIGQ